MEFNSQQVQRLEHECWICLHKPVNHNCILGWNRKHITYRTIFVGPPTTGKSQAIKECAITPAAAVARENDTSGCVIQKCTSSGLVKTVAEQEKGFLLSAEIYS